MVQQVDSLILQALETLNESPDHVYALSYNTRNSKWVVVRMDRMRDVEQAGTFHVRPFATGSTAAMACGDALRLRFVPEPTIADAVGHL